MSRERLKLGWSVDGQSSAGLVVEWVLAHGMKDHALEAILCFWLPFAVLSEQQNSVPGTSLVPALTAKAEALLAINKLERQISLLRQTFALDSPVPASSTSLPMVAPSQPAITVADTERTIISGFESFDQSLALDSTDG